MEVWLLWAHLGPLPQPETLDMGCAGSQEAHSCGSILPSMETDSDRNMLEAICASWSCQIPDVLPRSCMMYLAQLCHSCRAGSTRQPHWARSCNANQWESRWTCLSAAAFLSVGSKYCSTASAFFAGNLRTRPV